MHRARKIVVIHFKPEPHSHFTTTRTLVDSREARATPPSTLSATVGKELDITTLIINASRTVHSHPPHTKSHFAKT